MAHSSGVDTESVSSWLEVSSSREDDGCGREKEEFLIESASLESDDPFASATEFQLCMNIITGGLGTGILTIPWMIAGASIIPSFLMIAGVMILNVWSLGILVDVADAHQIFDVGMLLQIFHGKIGMVASASISVYIFLCLFVCLIGYVMSVSSILMDLLGKDSKGEDKFPYWASCLIVSVVALPLCYLDQSRLAFTSSFVVIAFFFIFVVVLVELFKNGIDENVCVFGAGKGTGAFFGGIANAVIIQMCILPMYKEMKDRTPAKMKKTIRWGFGGLFLLFGGFGIAGYLTYGEGVMDMITGSMSDATNNAVHVLIAQITLGLALFGVYPIICYGAMSPMQGLPENISKHMLYFIPVVVLASGALAIPLKGQLGKLNNVNGAIQAFIMCCGVPAFLGYKLLGLSAVPMGFLFVLGIIFCVVGLIWQDNFADELKCV